MVLNSHMHESLLVLSGVIVGTVFTCVGCHLSHMMIYYSMWYGLELKKHLENKYQLKLPAYDSLANLWALVCVQAGNINLTKLYYAYNLIYIANWFFNCCGL